MPPANAVAAPIERAVATAGAMCVIDWNRSSGSPIASRSRPLSAVVDATETLLSLSPLTPPSERPLLCGPRMQTATASVTALVRILPSSVALAHPSPVALPHVVTGVPNRRRSGRGSAGRITFGPAYRCPPVREDRRRRVVRGVPRLVRGVAAGSGRTRPADRHDRR